jgi:hypothetical protein
MSSLKQYPHVLVLFALLSILACKKNKPLKKEVSKDEEPVVKILIPVKFESTGLTVNLKYKENTALLTEITGTDGNKTIISYTNDLHLSKLEKYKNEKLYYSVYYEKDSKQSVNKAVLFEYNDLSHNYTPKGFYTLAYNDQHQLTEIKYYNTNATNNLIKADTRTYSSSGNLSASNILNYPDLANAVGYSFDNKKGISSHVVQSPLLALESEHWFLVSSVNNILGYTSQKVIAENVGFSYEYNEDGYPSKMVITKNKLSQSLNITYKALQQ